MLIDDTEHLFRSFFHGSREIKRRNFLSFGHAIASITGSESRDTYLHRNDFAKVRSIK